MKGKRKNDINVEGSGGRWKCKGGGKVWWVPVGSTGKVSDGYIRDLEFNSCLYQKLIDILI